MNSNVHPPESAPVVDNTPATAEPAAGRTQPKLDLSRVAPPRNLDSFDVEEITIDGICGVY